MNQELDLHAIIMRKKPSYVRGVKNKIFPNLLRQKFQVKARIWYGVQTLLI